MTSICEMEKKIAELKEENAKYKKSFEELALTQCCCSSDKYSDKELKEQINKLEKRVSFLEKSYITVLQCMLR